MILHRRLFDETALLPLPLHVGRAKVGIEGRGARLFLSLLPWVPSPPFLSLSSTAVH